MKNILIGLILISFSSCSIVKIISEQEMNILEKCTPIVFINDLPLINIAIDSVKSKFLLDTGATISVLTDSIAVSKFEEKKFVYYGSSVGADKKEVKNRFLTANMMLETFESKNKVFTYFNLPRRDCSKNQNFTGILGLDVFFHNRLALVLDFSSNQLCNISEIKKIELLKNEGYERIKSECKKRTICIFLKIENIEYKFKLDTGFSGNLIIPKSRTPNFNSENFTTLEGSAFATLSSTTVGDELIYHAMPITVGSQKFESIVIVSSTIAAQNAGIDFMRKFDWIIDYEKNEVYVKPNQNMKEPVEKNKIQYNATASNGKLVISLKDKSQTRYRIGDSIIAVNGQKVIQENICELQEFLNKTEDWNILDLKVIHH